MIRAGQLFPGLGRFIDVPSVPVIPSVPVNPLAPVNTAAPVVTGDLVTGATLTCDPGTWTNADSFAFVWLRSADGISGWEDSGDRGATFAAFRADGKFICCDVYGVNEDGQSVPVRSAAVGPVVAVDPYWADVVLLLSGDDVLTDLSTKAKVASATSAITSVATGTHFGSGSLEYPGAVNGAAGVYAPSADFHTQSINFTIEFWITPLANTVNPFLFGTAASSSKDFTYSASSYLSATSFGSTTSVLVALNERAHIALSRVGTTTHFFKNGVLIASTTGSALTNDGATPGLALFGMTGRADLKGLNCRLEEIRWTKGVGRWNASSSPAEVLPTGPYLTSGPP